MMVTNVTQKEIKKDKKCRFPSDAFWPILLQFKGQEFLTK